MQTQARSVAALVIVLSGVSSEASAAGALPNGGQFVAGAGTINTGASRVDIVQSSARGVIDWHSFSIGNGNSVNVDNGTGATLSRVTGADASLIDGGLKATGSFYLVNPQGVVIGANGIVTTGGRFVASALDIGNDAFMAGGALTFTGSGGGSVVNLGKISSTGGDVLLISRTLAENDGAISAPNGSAELAAGDQVLVRDSSAAPQTYVQAPTHGDAVNKGDIAAAQIALQAADGNVFALAGNNTALRATGTATRDGHVWLIAPDGTAHVHASIVATNADGSGGTVDTSGAKLHLDDADIHAAQWNLQSPLFNVGPRTTTTLLKQLNQGTSVSLDATQGDIVMERTLSWSGDASLNVNANRSVTIGPMATLGNTGGGNLTLRADASGIDNGGSVTNLGTIDWSKSTGVVSALYDMNGTYTAGTIRGNDAWSAAAFSGLKTQLTTYKLVNSTDDMSKIASDLGGAYALGKDLDYKDVPTGNGIASAINGVFAGQFDGMGHVIRNLSLDASTVPSQQYLGLFTVIGASGVVRNISVVDANVSGGYIDVGILAGLNQGLITNASVSGHSTATLGNSAGGIVDDNEGVIERSSSSASVYAAFVGGAFVAANGGSIVQSFATGDVSGTNGSTTGAFVYTNNGTITQSYSTGSAASAQVGGLAVYNFGTIGESFTSAAIGPNAAGAIAYQNAGTIDNNVFWDTQRTGAANGVYTGTSVPAANGLTTAQMSTSSSFGPTWDFNSDGVWAMPAGGTHPVLRWQTQSQ
jgi:filamentous hemagglutinin family protein